MQYRVEGIVIRSMDYGEGGKIITILTPTHGKAAILVRGAKKAKSRHGSLTQLFTHGEYLYYRNSGLGTLTHGEIIESHHVLREGLELTAYAAYAVELTDRTTNEDEASGYLFMQLLACLRALAEGKDGPTILQLYEMKILEVSGYGPIFDECVSCGNTEGQMALSARSGGVLCSRCRYKDSSALVLGDSVLKLLRLFRRMDLTRLGNIQVKDETKVQLKQAMRLLVDTHINIPLKSRAFLDQLDKYPL
ncbi:DNA repair protein RecO [Paenibacillus nasutitermitis]|uniref:DNA repair protein RecO n=1 Tax=Paenibacillus nasutitermitis TaxID=1652958 RepID=A0A917DUE5_9BACL|nr:DNA repair protein RecO [Paenibacillus nasutitermitis]GGD71362.1 DNA repair protein RecO [Paenibacillus nasutitermitis]